MLLSLWSNAAGLLTFSRHCPLSCSESFFSRVIRRDHITSALHSYTHNCRPLTYAASLALTGRAPAVLLCFTFCPSPQTASPERPLQRRDQSCCARRPSPLGQQQEFCCKFAGLCRTHQQIRRSTSRIVSAETEAGIFRCDKLLLSIWPSRNSDHSIPVLASPAPTLHCAERYAKTARRTPLLRHAIADTRQLQQVPCSRLRAPHSDWGRR